MTTPSSPRSAVPYVVPGSPLERKLIARRRRGLDVPDLTLTSAERTEIMRLRAQCRRALRGHHWTNVTAVSVPPHIAAAMGEMHTEHQLDNPDDLRSYDRELRRALYGEPAPARTSLFACLAASLTLVMASSLLPIHVYVQLAADVLALALIVAVVSSVARSEGSVRIDITHRDIDTGLSVIASTGHAGRLAVECDRELHALSASPDHVLAAIDHDDESLMQYRGRTLHRIAELAEQEEALSAVAGAVPGDVAAQHRALKQSVHDELDALAADVHDLRGQADEYEATLHTLTAPVDQGIAEAETRVAAEREVRRIAAARATGGQPGSASPPLGVARRRRWRRNG